MVKKRVALYTMAYLLVILFIAIFSASEGIGFLFIFIAGCGLVMLYSNKLLE